MTPYLFPGLNAEHQRDYNHKMLYHRDDNKIQFVTSIIFDHLKVDHAFIKERSGKREHVEARQIAMFLIKKHLKITYKIIGDYFGGRNHTIPMYAFDTVNDLMLTNINFKKKVEEAEKLLMSILSSAHN